MSKYKTAVPTVDQMIEAGVHFGHQVRRKNPRMDKFIYGAESKVSIVDLYKTKDELVKALDYLYEVAALGKQVVFVGTKRQAALIVKKYAQEANALYVNQRWLGGTLTNFESVKSNCDTLKALEEGLRTNSFAHYTKKERLLIERKIDKLEGLIGGIRDIQKYPGAIIIVDVKREKTAVREANALNIPVIGLVDTNSDPENINFPIPANDDAMKAIELIFSTMAEVLKEGYAAHKDKKAQEVADKEAKLKAEIKAKEVKIEAAKPVEKEIKEKETKKEQPKAPEKKEAKPAVESKAVEVKAAKPKKEEKPEAKKVKSSVKAK